MGKVHTIESFSSPFSDMPEETHRKETTRQILPLLDGMKIEDIKNCFARALDYILDTPVTIRPWPKDNESTNQGKRPADSIEVDSIPYNTAYTQNNSAQAHSSIKIFDNNGKLVGPTYDTEVQKENPRNSVSVTFSRISYLCQCPNCHKDFEVEESELAKKTLFGNNMYIHDCPHCKNSMPIYVKDKRPGVE